MQPPEDHTENPSDAQTDSGASDLAVETTDSSNLDPAISEFHKQKLRERREDWQINSRLATISAAVLVALVVLGTASYFYNSSAATQTFQLRAEEAAANGDALEESQWWARYLMMKPGDADAILKVAFSADEAAEQAAEQADGQEAAKAVSNARRRLAESLAQFPEDRKEEQQEIRRRLIRRLLQSGGFWLREAQQQIVMELDADINDVFAHKALALALSGQIEANLYEHSTSKSEPADNYWQWLVNQNAMVTLRRAAQLAPNDLDVIASLLRIASTHRDFLEENDQLVAKKSQLTSKEQQWVELLSDRNVLINQALRKLGEMESGRARLILYYYALQAGESNPSNAQTVLLSSAPNADTRLSEFSKAASQEQANQSLPADAEESVDSLQLTRQLSAEYWDYQVLLEAARLAAGIASGQVDIAGQSGEVSADVAEANDAEQERAKYRELADQWYATLMATSLPDVSAKMRENTFLYAGMHAELSDDPDQAIEIWKQGLTEVSLDNLELNGVIATRLARTAETDEELSAAEEAVGNFYKAIKAEKNRLVLSTTADLSQAQRNQIGRFIELATWRFNVAGAELRTRRDGGTKLTSEAIAKLKEALASNADVRPQEKAQLATNLASLYARHEVWDQAADALSIASDLLPNDVNLHVLAGEAWTKAGNRSRAAQHWRMAGASASLDIRVKAAQAEFNFQLRSPPAIRDFSGLRTRVAQLQDEYDKIVASAVENPFGENVNADEVESSIRILKMSLPPLGVLAEQHLASKQLAIFADELAAEKMKNASIQAYAAERLAAVGMNEKAAQRLEQMEKLQGENQASVVVVRARIDASNGKPVSAAQRLLEEVTKNPEGNDQLVRYASNYYLAARDLPAAYDALKQIPKARLLPNDLYRLYRQAKQLAGATDDQDAAKGLLAEAAGWSEQLKAMEEPPEGIDGVEIATVGTFWRMIAVEEKLDELRSRSADLSRKDDDVMEVRDWLDTILSQRPRWGHAISMKGYLSAILRNHEEAIEQLRAGIDAGDQSLRTRQLLLEQLIAAKRDGEADEEMKRMAMSVDFVVDPYAKQDIRSAFNRGELMAAVDAARQSTESNPTDPTSLIVFSRVASTAVQLDRDNAAKGDAKGQLTDQQRDELVDEARQAIEKAKGLSKENELALAAAALDLEFRHGTPESVETAWQRISGSELPEHERLLLESRVFISKGDLDGAIERLRESNLILPSVAAQVQLAQLYQAQGQSVDVVETLRKAVEMQPENQRLRTELAKAIVVTQGDQADWDEVESLLQTGDGATDSDRFVHATLLSVRGGAEQLAKALGIARSLAREQNETSYEASVLQITILVKLINEMGDAETGSDPGTRDRYLEEARMICRNLADTRSATSVDKYRYGAFLLKYGNDDDLRKVKSISDELAASPSGMLQSLELSLIYNQRMGSEQDPSGIIDGWVEKAKPDMDRRLLGGVESTAGQALMNLGQTDKGLSWFEKAYNSNEDALTNYIVALSKAKQHEKAAEITAAHYQKHGDASSATLLVESLLALDSKSVAAKYADILKDATQKHSRNAALVESVATWAMQRGTPQEAIKLYRQVLAIEPLRVRAINNIAIAYSQVPGMAGEGIVQIDRALKITNRNPELLDTKGSILLKAGRNKEALETFEEAIKSNEKPEARFQFHKILALLALGQQQEARELWDALDLNTINAQGLTQEEQQQLENMKSDFKAFANEQI